MTADLLGEIQTLQFHDRAAAEALLVGFLRDTLALDVTAVELRPLAVSLNSFNGFMTLADGRRLFFKTHTEPDNVIGEYYHAAALADAGYPVVQPILSSTETGKQILVYEVIRDPSVFDVAWAIETGDDQHLSALTRAQNDADDLLFQIYRQTLDEQTAQDAEAAPIHQLFSHRITGGRFERFYGPLPGQIGEYPTIQLPNGPVSMRRVRSIKWIINGVRYDITLDQLVGRAATLLQPAQSGPSIVGHGDAHNGNVFFHPADRNAATGATLEYFDPAFAGRHHPLLDLTKPLFHNVFAMWMYFPNIKRDLTRITLADEGDSWRLEHDYALHPVRDMFLRSKAERVLIPMLQELKQRGWLRSDWRTYLKASLFCCPLLTMNLADPDKFPPEISLLGLAMSVEMGGNSIGQRSLIDRTLDEAERSLT